MRNNLPTSFYSKSEIIKLGLKSIGINCKISKFANFYSPGSIEIGDNVRIDDFCIISGNIKMGSNIHISAYSALYGKDGIVINDYSGISPRSTLFSSVDDFSGQFLIGPIHPPDKTRLISGPVVLEKYVQVGANSIVMPNVVLHEGAVTGAFTFVNHNLEPWTINIGIPVKKFRDRQKDCMKLI